MAADLVLDKTYYNTSNGFALLHSQQQGFFRTYLQCDGDLAKTAEDMRCHFCTEEELALAAVAYGGPDSWFADFPRVTDLKAMLVDHVVRRRCPSLRPQL